MWIAGGELELLQGRPDGSGQRLWCVRSNRACKKNAGGQDGCEAREKLQHR
jgi:hypothetical protein